jgi:hypothetical protein
MTLSDYNFVISNVCSKNPRDVQDVDMEISNASFETSLSNDKNLLKIVR